MSDFQGVCGTDGDLDNPHGSMLEQRLVVAWRRWERSPEDRERTLEKQRVLEAWCEGETVTPTQLHDKITELRRARLDVEKAVRLTVLRYRDG